MAKSKRVKIGFLGGVGEIGKNMTVIEYGEDIIVVDAGLSFPNSEETPGIDHIIPDYTYLKENEEKIKGIFLTHGHEDHIGALPYLLRDINVPVYGSKMTLGIVKHKLDEAKLKNANLNKVKDRTVISAGKFSVEFVRVTHSIAGAYALSITTPKGVIFMTGDFKIDHTPIDKRTTDLERIAEIGASGVLLLMMDSTNVERNGYSMSEQNVFKALENQFEQNRDKRLIVATFASNVHRVQQIINCAVKYGRRVAFCGRSMKNIVEIAHGLNLLSYNEDDIIDLDKISKIPYDKVCIISTGTQGEPMSALTRMSNGDFKAVKISELDTILLSSSPIPGNEKFIYNVINNLCQKGANVVYQALSEIHVSGHACKEELKLMFSLLRPKYFIPVHGEYRHLKQHKDLAVSLGILEANVVLPSIGQVIEIDNKNGLIRSNNIPNGNIMIDGSIIQENVAMILRDRKTLSEDGLVVAIVNVNRDENAEYEQPIVVSRGISINESYNEELKEAIMTELNLGRFEELELSASKSYLRKFLAKELNNTIKKRPMIIPIIIE